MYDLEEIRVLDGPWDDDECDVFGGDENTVEDVVICGVCGCQCKLLTYRDGSFIDDAYGAPRRFPTFASVTSCCRSEDYELVPWEEYYGEE